VLSLNRQCVFEANVDRNALEEDQFRAQKKKYQVGQNFWAEDLFFYTKHDKSVIEVGQDCDWVRLGRTPV